MVTANRAQTAFLELETCKIAYRRFGQENGIPLVLFQRFRGTIDQWDPYFLDLLAIGRELVVFDSAGIGGSSGQVPESIAGMAEIAIQFLDRLGLERFDVLGWSMGGCVAQRIALDRPKQVRRLVLAATSPGAVTDGPKMPEKVLQTMAKPVNDDEDFLYLFFPETASGRAQGLAHLRRLEQRDEPPVPTVTANAFKAQLFAIRDWGQGRDAALPSLGELSQPILVANGQGDVMIPAYYSFVLAQRAPDARLILYPKSGHGFLFQCALEFTQHINEFLVP